MSAITNHAIKIELIIAIPQARGIGALCKERPVGLSTTYNFEDGFDNKKQNSQVKIAVPTTVNNSITLNKYSRSYLEYRSIEYALVKILIQILLFQYCRMNYQ